MNTYLAFGITVVLGFLIAYALGFVLIPLLKKLHFGQTILEIGPKWHKGKEGTPIMGGLMFIAASIVSFCAVYFTDKLMGGKVSMVNDMSFSADNVKLWGGIIMALGFAAIGFVDDYIKAVKKRNLGLNEKQKSILQIIIILGYLGSMYAAGADYMFIPFVGNVSMGIFFWLLGVFAIYCTVNAVNFTDGVDGLCGSVTLTAAVAFAIIAALRNYMGISLLAASLAGACGGYLIWNKFPAKVMMGDTGSMFLGGIIVAFAYAVDCPLLILPVGIIYVAEFGSDIIQITYFKYTKHKYGEGRRIFKMVPLHHHYEKSGWSEKKIVKVFSLVNILGCIAGIVIVYFGNPK